MGLDVQFRMGRTELAIQESPPCVLTLANAGPGLLRLFAPQSRRSLSVRIIDVATGAEVIQRPRALGFARDAMQTLGIGKSLQYDFELNEEVRLTAPGRYDISLVYEYMDAAGGNGLAHAESQPVRVTVLPDSPRNLSPVSVSGGVAAVCWGAWVNAASDPPRVMRGRFTMLPNGGVAQVLTIAPAGLRAKPVLSAPPNQNVLHAHWLAWIDREGAAAASRPAHAGAPVSLAFTHIDEHDAVLALGRFPLPAGDCELVEPLHSKPLTDTRIRPDGAALLWLLPAGETSPSLQMITLGAKPSAGPSSLMPPGKPDWMMSHERSNGQRFVTFLQTVGAEVRLRACSWPDQPPRGPAQPPPARGAAAGSLPRGCSELAAWPGRYAAAGAALNESDVLHGAVFLWTRAGNEPRLERVDWTIDPHEAFTEVRRQRVAWDFEQLLDDARVRFNVEGTPAALLHESTGRWVVCTADGELKPVPAPYTQTRHPIDLGFFGATDPPVLILARPLLGFELRMIDGSPLPHRHG